MSLGRVLVIDDEVQVAMVRVLVSLGYQGRCAPDGPRGLHLVGSFRPDVVLLDYHLPGMTGHEVLRMLRREHPGLPVLLITGSDDERIESTALDLGALHCLRKPVDLEVLRRALSSAMGSRATTEEPDRL